MIPPGFPETDFPLILTFRIRSYHIQRTVLYNHRMHFALYAALVLIPALPLSLTWGCLLMGRESLSAYSPLTVKVPLLITTGTCLLHFVNLFSLSTTNGDGVSYSDSRVTVIVTSFVVSLAMVILSVLGKGRLRWLLAASSAAVALGWLYFWAMSAAV